MVEEYVQEEKIQGIIKRVSKRRIVLKIALLFLILISLLYFIFLPFRVNVNDTFTFL